MSISKLFRQEVFDARREAWLGRVQVVQPLPVRVVAGASLVLIVACIGYGWIGTYTRRVHATGMLMPSTGLITVASPAAGIVTSTAAAEGEKVHKGQLLFVVGLDATSSGGPTQQHVIAALRDQKATMARERELRRTMAALEKQGLANQLENLSQQHTQLASEIAIENETIPLLKSKAEQLQGAVRRGLVQDSQYQNQNYLYMQALAQRAAYQQNYLEIEGKMAQTSEQLSEFDDKLARDLNEMQRAILQLDQQVSEAEAKRAIEIQAPADGTLTGVRVHAGQPVASGTSLVTLLPNTGKLEAELFVDSSAIGFIDNGKPVFLRYAAYPFQRFGLYRGKVTEVTRAPVGAADSPGTSQAAQNGKADERALYRIVVDPTLPYVVAYGNEQPLEAGMQVDADIALDKRPLYRWVLDPFYHIRSSMKIISGAGLK